MNKIIWHCLGIELKIQMKIFKLIVANSINTSKIYIYLLKYIYIYNFLYKVNFTEETIHIKYIFKNLMKNIKILNKIIILVFYFCHFDEQVKK